MLKPNAAPLPARRDAPPVHVPLMDVTLAVAARSVAKDMGVVTIEMKTSFMRPARGRLIGTGRLIHRTATLAFCDAMIHDEGGQPCAQATGTFKYVKRLAVGPKGVQALNVISTD